MEPEAGPGDGLIQDLPAKLSAALPSSGFCVVTPVRTMQVLEWAAAIFGTSGGNSRFIQQQ